MSIVRILALLGALLVAAPASATDHQAAYLGCFKDQGAATGTKGRDLSGYAFNADDMSTGLCVGTCRSKGFAYAGTQYGRWCFCGNSYGASGPAKNCNMRCSGSSETCGGTWANSVYQAN